MVAGIASYGSDLVPRIGCWAAARVLHNSLLYGMFRVPLSFNDVTPIGRILLRFSKDIDVMDNTLPAQFSDLLYCTFDVCCF